MLLLLRKHPVLEHFLLLILTTTTTDITNGLKIKGNREANKLLHAEQLLLVACIISLSHDHQTTCTSNPQAKFATAPTHHRLHDTDEDRNCLKGSSRRQQSAAGHRQFYINDAMTSIKEKPVWEVKSNREKSCGVSQSLDDVSCATIAPHTNVYAGYPRAAYAR